jgi:hypothetical protein
VSKPVPPPPRPGGRPAARPAAPPPPRGFAAHPVRLAPPPAAGRPPQAATAQRFASFSNRTAADAGRKAPPGDELVALGQDSFGARSAAQGLITRPDGTYNFVRTQGLRRMDQRTLISAKAGHAQLSQGRPVVYAGTVRFSAGAIDWWSNYSGHFQPIAAFRRQAQLPDDKFVPWQRLQLGGTAMQRGLFRDRRPAAGPEPQEKKAERAPAAAAARPGAEKPARSEKPAGAPAAAARGAAAPAKK